MFITERFPPSANVLDAEGPSLLATAPRANLTFFVLSPVRGGGQMVSTALDNHPQVVCLSDLLHHSGERRKESHERYYGPPGSVERPEYCRFDDPNDPTNPEQYLRTYVCDAPAEASSFGAWFTYRQLLTHDLWDFLEEQTRLGSFCVIHVRRNPLATFLSRLRAEQCGVWSVPATETPRRHFSTPLWISGDQRQELVDHIYQHETCQARIEQVCSDRLDIDFHQLVENYPAAYSQICEHLEIEKSFCLPPSTVPLSGRTTRSEFISLSAGSSPVLHPYLNDPLLC